MQWVAVLCNVRCLQLIFEQALLELQLLLLLLKLANMFLQSNTSSFQI